MKKKHAGYKDLSEKFAKDNIEGHPAPDKKLEHRKSKPSPRNLPRSKLTHGHATRKHWHEPSKQLEILQRISESVNGSHPY